MKTVLSIAGSDCSGGAGIQGDIKTITVHRMYAMSVVTALTAQNTTGVYALEEVSAEFVEKQIDCVMTDIFPDSIKIGMVSSSEIIESISRKLEEYEYKDKNIVIDPVMVSTSGSRLLDENALKSLKERLFPLAKIITPNIYEAECLTGLTIKDKNHMEEAAIIISKSYKGGILIKGGHLENCCDDLLYYDNRLIWYPYKKIDNPNIHGTGCTLSSAIACNLAKGYGVEDSIKIAKEYINKVIGEKLKLGKGKGPLKHFI